jgi:zinc transporter ZupT
VIIFVSPRNRLSFDYDARNFSVAGSSFLLHTLSMLILLCLAAFLATLFGGLFALKFKDKLHLILGFSAGAVIAVAFFDLIPEALDLGLQYSASSITSVVALGFAVYMILDRFFLHHCHEEDDHEHESATARGTVGAGSLSVHSFLDGVAIGLSFQVSAAVGVIVAVAVLVHDFSDGINTVSFILKNNGNRKQAFTWLVVDAIAPTIGIIFTLFIHLPSEWLALILALFAGFFLYIGASDLLPESHHNHPTVWTTVATLLGMLVLFGAIQLAGV